MSTEIATWRIPQGFSAIKGNNIIERAKHYRFSLRHYLLDGTRVIPKIGTVFSVIQSFDTFGDDVPVTVCEDSYDVLDPCLSESQFEEQKMHIKMCIN
jgi:hypothetical protein